LYIELHGNLFLSIKPAFGYLLSGFTCPVLRRAKRRFWLRTPETWRLRFSYRNYFRQPLPGKPQKFVYEKSGCALQPLTLLKTKLI